MKTFTEHIDKHDNISIIVIAFIADKGPLGAEWKDIFNLYFQNGYLTSEEKDNLTKYYRVKNNDLDQATLEKFSKLFISISHVDNFVHMTDSNVTLLFGGLSDLLDFIELKTARKNSVEARNFSVWAIIISLVSLFVSATIGIYQVNSSIKLEDSQLNKLTKTEFNKFDFDTIKEHLDYSNKKLDSIYLRIKKQKKQ